MKGRIRTIEANIYQQESGKYQVEMNYTHPETGRKSKKRRVFSNLTQARRWKKEFKAQQTLGSLPLKDIRKSLTTACHAAGVERFTIHHLRHLATTVLLEATNGDRDLVKRVIGWSSMDMIDRYGHIGNRAIPAFNTINAQLANGLRATR